MAEVFAGSTRGAEGFSRKVAIKRVLPGFSDNAGFSQMFVAEARISARLVHPNIVSVLDFDRDDDGRLFLVMELVEGADLDALLATGLLPFPVVIAVIAEVLRGLGFAHDLPTASDIRGVVHRDVSPHNVLLSWEGAVKVSDFGIAKARAASEATASVFIKGKPAYMSPEQANGQPLDGRSDLFAVGVVLWEMLVGQRLFVGQDTRATLAAVLFGQIPRPRALRPAVPRDLERVTMKLLDRELAARYAAAELAIADLMKCGDAPRAGREAVSAILAERFADRAPVRHSVARAREAAVAPAPPPGSAPLYSRPTLTGAPDQRIELPAASAFAATAASTGGLAARSRRWPGLALLAAVLFVASSVAGFVVVSLVRRPAIAAHTAGGSATSSGIAAPGEPAQHAVQSPQPAAPDGPIGSLRVVGAPILTVTIDGAPHGTTPLTIPLAAGPHRVRLQNLEHHIDDTVAVTIVDHQTYTIDRMPK